MGGHLWRLARRRYGKLAKRELQETADLGSVIHFIKGQNIQWLSHVLKKIRRKRFSNGTGKKAHAYVF